MTTGSSLSLCHSVPSDASPAPPALAASAVYSATLVRSTCGTKYSGSALSSTTTWMSRPDSSTPNSSTRSRTSSGPIRFIGGASITTLSTPGSAGATRSVRYPSVIAGLLRTRAGPGKGSLSGQQRIAPVEDPGGCPSVRFPGRGAQGPPEDRQGPAAPWAAQGSHGGDRSRGPRSLMATGPKKPGGIADTASERDPEGRNEERKTTRARRCGELRCPQCSAVSVAAAVLAAGAGGAVAAPASGGANPIVRIDGGLSRGASAAGVNSFLGLPYAAPPTGNLRWRPRSPRRPGQESGTRRSSGRAARRHDGQPVPAARAVSEDCLYLNVYTPTLRSRQ